MTDEAIALADRLMRAFAERTGLLSGREPRRYLWTDAFAVRNLLELALLTGDEHQTALALALIEQVHHVLGRFRGDDRRAGWLSGLSARDGEDHPTRGGLRIGKPLPERSAGQAFDADEEWDRDGQYFHYLTQWMGALDQAAARTGNATYNRWARELAEVAHAAFTAPFRARGERRLAWKMSVDLSRPLVPSTGQHDALDGYVTCLGLEATARLLGGESEGPALGHAIAELEAMAGETDPRTVDPLGLGGLLLDACRLAALESSGGATGSIDVAMLFGAAEAGLAGYRARGDWRQPAFRRLGFRELGLALGLSAVERLCTGAYGECQAPAAGRLASAAELGAALVRFWVEPEHRQAASWREHLDINDVMLATSLLPDACLPPSLPGGTAHHAS